MNDISNFLAKQLDALKLSNPVIFVLVQAVLMSLLGLIQSGSLSLPVVPILGSLNDLVGTVLITTMALIGTRTTSFLK
jgi:hypothetical protein